MTGMAIIIDINEKTTRGNCRILLLFLAFIRFNITHISAVFRIGINALITSIIV